jgi:hypothetical protein
MVVTDLDVNGALRQHSPLEGQLQATLNIVPAHAWPDVLVIVNALLVMTRRQWSP